MMSLGQHTQQDDVQQLFEAVLTLNNPQECAAFFGDLFTKQELIAFAQRLQIARLLREGSTYDMVRSQIPVSSSTITRVNTELRYGAGGYQLVLERIGK